MKKISPDQFNYIIAAIIINIICTATDGIIYSIKSTPFLMTPNYLQVGLEWIAGICWIYVLFGLKKIFFKYKTIRQLIVWMIVLGIIYMPAMLLYMAPGLNVIGSLLMMIPYMGLIITILIFDIIILAHPDRQKFIFKQLKIFSVLDIISVCFVFGFSMIIGMIVYFVPEISKIWFLSYLISTVPYFFLVKYFLQLKKIYPEILLEADTVSQKDTNWPPPSNI